MDALWIQALVARHVEERSNDIAANPCCTGLAGDAKSVSAACDFDIKSAFNLAKMLVELSAEVGETIVIGGLQDNVPGNLGVV